MNALSNETKLKIEKTIKNLKANKMDAYYCDNKEDACNLVKTLIKKGDVISSGGSVTLKETGVYDIITSSNYKYLDRAAEGITPEEVEEVYHKTFFSDVYLRAVMRLQKTENCIMLMQFNCVQAILYGPKSVILVCGYNKIVKNIDEAIDRVKRIAAPSNTIRLNIETPCGKTGKCITADKEGAELCSGCKSDRRICCNYVVCAQQRHKDRIKVIIIGEKYGY